MDPASAGDARRAVGRMAVFHAGLGLAQDPQPEHVHPDCHGHGCRMGLQHDRRTYP